MKKFSFSKMWFEPIFFTGSLAVFKFAISGRNFWGLRAAFGGEMRSNYFKNTAPVRKLQAVLCTAAASGGQIVGNFGLKNQLAISSGKENFSITKGEKL